MRFRLALIILGALATALVTPLPVNTMKLHHPPPSPGRTKYKLGERKSRR
jgi:hypothetical protein